VTLKISSTALEMVAEQQRSAWAGDASHQLYETYPGYFSALDVTTTDLVPFCHQVERWAARHEVTGTREVFRLLLVAVSMGHRFWQDPRFQPYVNMSVKNPDIAASRRAMAMVDNSKVWLRLLWQGDDLNAFADRLTGSLRSGAIAGLNDIRIILPQHWQIIPVADNQRLTDWLLQVLPADRFPTTYQRLAYLALALVHGVHWLTDPQYAVFVAAIDDAIDAPDLADRLAAIYGRMA